MGELLLWLLATAPPPPPAPPPAAPGTGSPLDGISGLIIAITGLITGLASAAVVVLGALRTARRDADQHDAERAELRRLRAQLADRDRDHPMHPARPGCTDPTPGGDPA